jgi:DNA polymerase-3 subunit delta'
MSLPAREALPLLEKAHAQNRLAHAYLVTGPKGAGKRQLVLGLCARLLECAPGETLSHPDFHSLAPESRSRKITTDQVRELEGKIHVRSLRGGAKAVLIFDADRLVPAAANAFLKTLEEPPAGTHIFLLSEQPEQLLETILSRCVQISLRPTEHPEPTDAESGVAQLLCTFFNNRKPNLTGGLWLAQQLQALLSQMKEALTDAMEAEFKAEGKRYKDVVDPKWLEQLEESYAARTEAAYIGERNRMVEVLEAFWADVLLTQNQRPARHLPECAEHAARLAEALQPSDILSRVEALGRMRDQLGRSGVSEPLAIEHGILCGFAPETAAPAG